MAKPAMSDLEAARLRARNLRTVGALAALFVLPLVASFVLYYGLHWAPAGSVNHGELIQPVRALSRVSLKDVQGATVDDVFEGYWTLVYVGDGGCDAACREALIFMRQTRLSLNQEMTRVHRVFLTTGSAVDARFLQAEHPGLVALDASGAEGQALLAKFAFEQRANSLFIVDPLGNLMMRYDVHLPPKGLLTDLKKLLQLSHIG